MKVTLLSSCGLALCAEGQTLLIDALNKSFRCFYGLPVAEFEKMLAGTGDYAGLCGVVSTHAHPDHYNESRTRALCAARSVPSFVPRADTPPCQTLQFGPFTVECHRFAHTPVAGWDQVTHGVLFITAGQTSVYLTADARPDVAQHRAILAGRRATAAFWNGQYLSHPQTRALLAEAAEKNYVYHIPVDPADRSGIRRKCEINLARFGPELSHTTLLRQYPTQLHL